MSDGLDLMTSTAVAVVRQPGLVWTPPAWELWTSTGHLIGSAARLQGRAARYEVLDAAGNTTWVFDQTAIRQIARFVVADRAGTPVGEVLQENALFTPQFRLTEPLGATVRLDGGKSRTGQWTIQDLAGQALGTVTRQLAAESDLLQARTYLVERGDGLGGELWPLALISSLCLDIVQGRKT